MYTHALDPVLFSVGPFTAYWYGLVYALGFLFLYYFIPKYGLLDEGLTDNYVLTMLISMLLGSRVFTYVFWYPEQLLANPLQLFYVHQGGMSFHGAFVGMFLGTLWYCQRHEQDPYKLLGALSIPLAFFLGVGRIANFINAELVGTVTNVSWCVIFPPEQLCRHPYQLYAALKNFAIIPFLYFYSFKTPKQRFWVFVLLYSALRVVVDVWRAEPTTAFFLSTGQLLSLATAGVATYILVQRT